ncbi:hypothetical protein Tco_0748822 [Tanacetum coccineum]|uniref:Uncharacterized protein n=1 Tax=Tanacetum coccineum TaxID=301880 RepID=A0ABQ4YXP1_9ASTR
MSLVKTADARLQIVMVNIKWMCIVEETRNCPAQNNESGQLESQKCLFVIREKFTSEITDEELREFTSEYYIPFALHPVVPAASASIADFPEGKVGCYTKKLDALRRWREMFFWVDDALVPWDFAFYTQAQAGDRGVRPLRDGEEPLLESTAGRTMELVLEQPEVESTDVLAPTPLRSVPGATVEPPRLDATSVGSSEDADVAGAKSEAGEVNLGGSTSTEEETPDAPPTLAAKEVTEDSSPNIEATSDSSAPVMHAVQSPPQTSPLTADDISRRDRETGPKAFEGMPVDQFVEEFYMVTAQQAALLAVAQAMGRVIEVLCTEACREKMALLVKVEHSESENAVEITRQVSGGAVGDSRRRIYANSVLSMMRSLPYMLVRYCRSAGGLIKTMMSAPCFISGGIQEVKPSFGDVVEGVLWRGTLVRGKAEAVEELHEKKLLTVPAAQVPGYNDNAYEELVAAMETMKLLELPHIAQLERDQDYPIDVIMAGLTLARHATEGAEAQPDYFLKPDVAQLQVPIFARPRDILNPFALEKEIPLKESLEAHAIRLAKKKGVKGKAILCGVGAAHIPRSDGVPVSVATVSPKDSELLGKLEEAGDAAYQVGSSEQSRCHSI